MATAASESGSWSETQTETVSSIVGLEIARITEREGVAIWQATDHRQDGGTGAFGHGIAQRAEQFHFGNDVGRLMDAGERRIDGPAHEIELARQHERDADKLGERNGALRRARERHLDRRDQKNPSTSSGWKLTPRIGPAPCITAMSIRPFMISSLKATAKPSTMCSMMSGCVSRAALSSASDSVPPALYGARPTDTWPDSDVEERFTSASACSNCFRIAWAWR